MWFKVSEFLSFISESVAQAVKSIKAPVHYRNWFNSTSHVSSNKLLHTHRELRFIMSLNTSVAHWNRNFVTLNNEIKTFSFAFYRAFLLFAWKIAIRSVRVSCCITSEDVRGIRVSNWRNDWTPRNICGWQAIEVPSDVLRARAYDIGRYHIDGRRYEHLWFGAGEPNGYDDEDYDLWRDGSPQKIYI